MRSKKLILIVKEIFGWLLSIIILVPLLLVIFNSLKTNTEADLMSLQLPQKMQWVNYSDVIEKGYMLRSFMNSMLISVIAVAVTVIVSAMASFILSRNKNKLNNGVYFYFLAGLVAPLNMVPVIGILKVLGLINTYQGIILLYVSLLIPFSIFLYYGYMESIPKELDEAALIDGSNTYQLFFIILLPLLKPVTITVIVINFMNTWNDFMIPLYILNKSEMWNMILSVYNFYGKYVRHWNLVSATIVLTIIPILIVYIFGQKYIISGMTAGAIKG